MNTATYNKPWEVWVKHPYGERLHKRYTSRALAIQAVRALKAMGRKAASRKRK